MDIQTWMEFNNSRNSSNSDDLSLSNMFSMLPSEDDDDSSQDEDIIELDISDDENSNRESSSGTDISDDESEYFDCRASLDEYFECLQDIDNEDPFAQDDGGDEFIPYVKKEAKRKRLYSNFCAFKFACGKGLCCSYKHTIKEKEFFKLLPDPKRRRLYTIKPCYHALCTYRAKPYLCSYAHNLEESQCLACKQRGNGQHWMDQCPASPRINS